MKTATLYEIRDDLDALAALLAEVGGDVTEAEAEAAIDEWLRETDEAMRAKLDRYAALVRELDARSTTRKQESDRLNALAKSDAGAVERLKTRLLWFLTDQGQTKVETARFRLTVAGNGGKTPVILRAEPEQLPEPYRTTITTVRADLEAIREALEAGETLEFASLGTRGTHLRIT